VVDARTLKVELIRESDGGYGVVVTSAPARPATPPKKTPPKKAAGGRR
jgi:hypothetical protein